MISQSLASNSGASPVLPGRSCSPGSQKAGADAAEAVTVGPAVGEGTFDGAPEALAVVRVMVVRELMDEDVVHELGRELHGGLVDVDLAVGGQEPQR